jgi:hypothetical protein
MEAVCSPETSAVFYRTPWYYIPEYNIFFKYSFLIKTFMHTTTLFEATSRKFTGSNPDEVTGFFSIYLIFQTHYGPWGRLSL